LYSEEQAGAKMLKIGSLCTGYGGLDMAVEEYFNAETVWVSEIDKHASKVIELRLNKPNLGDLKKINWANVEPIDILTAGYPCQPFSQAGNRKGTDDARHIWPNIKEGISILRPRYVILENVRGHLSLGFKEVLKDLAEIGYDAKWQIVRASDVGAPHRRERLFIIAYPQSGGSGIQQCGNQTPQSKFRNHNQIIANTNSFRQQIQTKRKYSSKQKFASISNIKTTSHTNSCSCEESRRANSCVQRTPKPIINGSDRYVHGFSLEMDRQTIPNPLDQDGKLNAKFVEYMMGLPEGWVTDAGLSRTQQLKMLGNGVVPQQALFALSQIMR